MAPRDLEREIDRLYQLPLDEFTAARNALAKDFAGSSATRIKALAKPSVSAWAVNQLYWNDRDAWDELIRSASHLRSVHRAMLSGRSADVRDADAAHRRALSFSAKATLALLASRGHPATSATEQAITRTLEALPVDEPSGRLSAPLEPAGFEALAGLSALLPSGDKGRKAEPGSSPRAVAGRSRESRSGKTTPVATSTGAALSKQEDARSRARREAARKAIADAERDAQAAADRARTLEVDVRAQTKRAEKAARDEGRLREQAEEVRRQLQSADEDVETARRGAHEAERELADLKREAERAGAASLRATARLDELRRESDG